MRKKKLAKNTISSLIYQITTIVCGFILPHFMLNYFGSEVNGMVSSITQFLQIIAFLDLGVGNVVQSALYKPLAEKNNEQISSIMKSAEKFFKRLALILLLYVTILVVVYPLVSNQNYSFLFTATLIISMSISSFAQYYFGVVDRLLILADQRGYVQYNIQTITLILNTLACSIFIVCGASIQVVKLTTSLIYLLRPLGFKLYVQHYYHINRNIVYKGEPIKQKWNGIAQHISAVVLDGTDSIVLTIFATLSDVSIYSVYHLVVYGVKQLFISLTSGIQSLMGELWAKQENENLMEFFAWVEWSIHTGVVFVFSCTGILIVSFVRIYTKGIMDAQYIQPLFALILVVANAMHCLRLPYNLMILAGGHYKQTQNNYIVAAVINIVLSVIFVKREGLVGVAIGTLVAMLYQTVWMAYYDSKNLIKWPFLSFVKQILVDIGTVVFICFATSFMDLEANNYFEWILCGIKVAFCSLIIIMVMNGLFYRDKGQKLIDAIIHKMNGDMK